MAISGLHSWCLPSTANLLCLPAPVKFPFLKIHCWQQSLIKNYHSKNQNQTNFFLCPVEKASFFLPSDFSERRHYLGIFYCDSLTPEQRFRTKNLMTQFRRFCTSLYKAYWYPNGRQPSHMLLLQVEKEKEKKLFDCCDWKSSEGDEWSGLCCKEIRKQGNDKKGTKAKTKTKHNYK